MALFNLHHYTSTIVHSYYEEEKTIKVEELSDAIVQTSGLEFTEKEINQALKERTEFFCVTKGNIVGLTEEGNKKIHVEKDKEFDTVLMRYAEQFHIDKPSDEIKELINKFLYDSVENNIEALLEVVKGTGTRKELIQLDKLSNEDRKIINDFIDWDDEQKNILLFEIVSFAVDYCCLTVKKDQKNFATLLQGKTFYLDANILFRMLGLNNEKRQETTMRFINKCKDAKIKLSMTSYTKTETLESIKYHVGQVKKIMQGYKGSGKALKKLQEKSNYEDGFLTEYLSWSSKNGINGHYDEFNKDLERKFYEAIHDIRPEDTGEIKIPDGMLEDYISWKDGKITKENAQYDVQNLLFIEKKRKQKSNTIGWNVGEYLISADHKLIKWSAEKFNKENPIAVLPSVWYSMLLKLQGRAKDDDIKAFSEFIKIRYIQDKPTENIQYLINKVCQKTSSGALQDMLFDEIADNNDNINALSFDDSEQLDEIVEQAYDDVLQKEKNEGYISGTKDGRKEGYDEGRSKGETIGWIKAEIAHIRAEISTNVNKTRRRNIGITVGVTLGIFVVCLMALMVSPGDCFANWKIAAKVALTILPSGIVGTILWAIFPLDIEKIQKIEEAKVQPRLDELQSRLKMYE